MGGGPLPTPSTVPRNLDLAKGALGNEEQFPLCQLRGRKVMTLSPDKQRLSLCSESSIRILTENRGGYPVHFHP